MIESTKKYIISAIIIGATVNFLVINENSILHEDIGQHLPESGPVYIQHNALVIAQTGTTTIATQYSV